MPAVPQDTAAGAGSPFDVALGALEGELSIVFASPDRVRDACGAVRALLLDTQAPDHDERIRRVASLVHSRSGSIVQPVLDLVCAAARADPRPWTAIEHLLAGRDADVCERALVCAQELVEAGSLRVDAGVVAALSALADREETPLVGERCLAKIAPLLIQALTGEASRGDAVLTAFQTTESATMRRLCARLLDSRGIPPAAEVVRGLLGEDDASTLAQLLAYTRACHLDLSDLPRRCGGPAPVAASVRAAESVCDRAILADVIGELGWHRVNLGLDARPVVGVSVDDSLPFLVTPAEAGLLAGCRGARRAFERTVVIAQGGSWDARDTAVSSYDAVAGFRAYNLAHAEVLADFLDVAPLTAERVRRLLDRMDAIAGAFATLFASRTEEAAALPGLYASLRARITAELASAVPGRPLSIELTRLVQMFEDPGSLAAVTTLHGLKRYLHQCGLALGFSLLESSHGTNRTVDFAVTSSDRVLALVQCVEYVDFDPEPAPGNAPATVPYPVAIVVEAFVRQCLHGQTSLPRVRVYCYGNEVHYFVSFKNHPVFIRIDFSPPLGGGMIDLVYYGVSKYELDAHPALALDAIQGVFARLDFFVEIDNTRVHARYDKERALDLADVCEKAEALFRLVPYLMDLDWTVGSLELPEEARREVGRAWADLFARWGVLPLGRLLTEDRTGVLVGRDVRPEGTREIRWDGTGPYEDAVTGRPRTGLPAEMHAALSARGLDVPLVEREVGQLSLETHLLGPLRAAIARGELIETGDGLRPAPSERFRRLHEADRFALLLASDPAALAAASRMARLATALERSLRFETTGSVNGHDVQRAPLVLRGSRGALYALRDPAGIFRLAIYSSEDAICLRRDDPAGSWHDNVSCDVGALAALLRRNNFLPSWIDAPTTCGEPEAQHVREIFTAPNSAGRSRPLPGARSVACLKASPGRAVGIARLGTRGRHPDDLDGGVLFAAALDPQDQTFLLHAAAIVGTGGGILSHAGLMAVQCGRPAVIMRGTWREGPGGAPTLAYIRTEFDERERVVAHCRVVERRGVRQYEEQIHEGDLVVADADEGVLQVLGQGPSAIALHETLGHLDQATRRLATAVSPEEVLALRGRRLRAVHQLEKLVARLDDPALVQHAVRELLTGESAIPGEGIGRERAHLLRLLSDHPAMGTVARECIGRVTREAGERHAAALDLALRLVASARSPDEVLSLRRSVLHHVSVLDQVRAFAGSWEAEGPAPAGPGGEPDIDALARLRLRDMLDELVAEAQGIGRADVAHPRLRHVVRRACRLGEVVGMAPSDRAALEALRTALQGHDDGVVRHLSARRVLWPADGGLEVEPLAGSKAANLAELARVGAAAFVPRWFVVTDRAFRVALDALAPERPGSPWSAGGAGLTLGEAIDAVVARADADPAQKSALIRQLWADVRLPAALLEEVAAAYRRLDEAEEPYVAIRSSAREEDTETAVRAGEFDTFLFVRGTPAVLEHLRRAWSGLWTARAIHDRAVYGRGGRGEGGGVLVQRIVRSRVAGVLQTTNVAEGRAREMVVNAGLGLGEGVVSGLVSADHIVISKDEDPETEPLRFHYVTNDKRERVIFDERRGHGTIRADVLAHQRLRPALEYVELVELARIATRLEAVYGYPLDIEFGVEGTALWILQVRPVPGSLAVWRDAIERHPLAGAGTAAPEAAGPGRGAPAGP